MATRRWTVELTVEHVTALQTEAEEWLDAEEVTGRAEFVASMVLEEILLNLVSHSDGRSAEVDLAADDERVTVCITDDGAPFDPLLAPPLDTTALLADRRPGGMGLHLVRQLTDEVRYEVHDGRNRLTATVGRR